VGIPPDVDACYLICFDLSRACPLYTDKQLTITFARSQELYNPPANHLSGSSPRARVTSVYRKTRPRTPPRSTPASALSRHSTYSIQSVKSRCTRKRAGAWKVHRKEERNQLPVSRHAPAQPINVNREKFPTNRRRSTQSSALSRCTTSSMPSIQTAAQGNTLKSWRCIGRRISREHRNTLRSHNG
jgi:hypothetical protein